MSGFAGTSALLYGMKLNSKKLLGRFLLSRGLLLVLLELTIIRFEWTFNFNYAAFTLAGVIWMLGWCMVIMAALVQLNALWVGIIGVAIIAFQQIFHYVPGLFPASAQQPVGEIWSFFYPCGVEQEHIAILYVLIPWIGVMAAGYGFGKIILLLPDRRKRICLITGLSAIAIFLVAGIITLLSQTPAPDAPPFIFRLLNQQKYPPSQLFLMMTIGPLIALVPFAEKARGWIADTLSMFGKVPFFFYLAHILLIHITALLVNLIRAGQAHQDWYNTAPYTRLPEPSRWGLPWLYFIYLIDMVLLYFICRWYAYYKFKHPEKKLLKYI